MPVTLVVRWRSHNLTLFVMSLKREEDNMGEKGKKDNGKRKIQKKIHLTLKEKRSKKNKR
jgi:hypothetical protein